MRRLYFLAPLRLPPRRALIVLSLELLCDFSAMPRPIEGTEEGGIEGSTGETVATAAAGGGVAIGTTVFSPP